MKEECVCIYGEQQLLWISIFCSHKKCIKKIISDHENYNEIEVLNGDRDSEGYIRWSNIDYNIYKNFIEIPHEKLGESLLLERYPLHF